MVIPKNEEKLNDERDDRKRLEESLESNRPIAAAYYMKDELHQICKQKTKAKVKECLKHWVKKA
jgi:hypothetical protein